MHWGAPAFIITALRAVREHVTSQSGLPRARLCRSSLLLALHFQPGFKTPTLLPSARYANIYYALAQCLGVKAQITAPITFN